MEKQTYKQTIEKSKRFSVIIAAYNIENYIERAIKSAINQTLENIEIIVVDDYSKDMTRDKILNLCLKHDNIIYVEHDKNKGLGGARNSGLNIAKGEYIIFLDGDDCFADDTVLEKLDRLIDRDIVDVTYLGFEIEGTKKEIIIPNEENCTKTYKVAIDKYPNVWSKCWRKEFLDNNKIRFKEDRFYEDVLFIYDGVMKSQSFKIADFIVHKYTMGRVNSITTNISLKNVEDTIKNLNDLLDIRERSYTREIDMLIKKEINMCKKRLDDAFINID